MSHVRPRGVKFYLFLHISPLRAKNIGYFVRFCGSGVVSWLLLARAPEARRSRARID
jgi:hypothetical protein